MAQDSFLLFPSTGSVFEMFASALNVFLDADLSLCPGGQGDREKRRRRGVGNDCILNLFVILFQSHLQREWKGREVRGEGSHREKRGEQRKGVERT
jgi:hypothetical protein